MSRYSTKKGGFWGVRGRNAVVPHRFELRGVIASTGFESGDRMVVGAWTDGPLGPMNDVMWVSPDGRRKLIAPDDRVAEFVSSIYSFEEIELEPVKVSISKWELRVTTPSLRATLQLGRSIPIPLGRLRSPWITRYVEGPIAHALMNVNTYGVAQSGIHEWYRADSLQHVTSVTAEADAVDLGSMKPVDPPVRVGFSEPPKRPSAVRVRPMLFDPSGELDQLVARLRR